MHKATVESTLTVFTLHEMQFYRKCVWKSHTHTHTHTTENKVSFTESCTGFKKATASDLASLQSAHPAY